MSGSVTPELRNWSGTYRFTARTVIAARTVDDVRRAVTSAGRVRALGTRHSFNDLADNGDTLVTVTGIAPEPVLDEAARTVTVGAGVSYGAVAGWLQQRGWALHNLGSLPHISVAGATATGTHGSGSRNQILSAAVAALEYVDADGELRRAGRADPGFDGLAVGLGAFGVVVRVTLDVQPSYLVRQDVYAGLRWDRVLAELDAVLSAAYSVSLFTDWSGETLEAAWVKRRLRRAGTGRHSRTAGVLRQSPRPGPAAAGRRPGRQPHGGRGGRPVVGAAAAFPHRLPAKQRGRDPVRVLRRPGSGSGRPGRRPAAVAADHAAAAGVGVPRHRPGPAVAERVVRAGDAGDPLHLAQPPRPGQRGADRGRGGAGAVRRPPALGKRSHIQAGQPERLYPRLADARAQFERLDPGDGSATRGSSGWASASPGPYRGAPR